jgi:hypothetical protein
MSDGLLLCGATEFPAMRRAILSAIILAWSSILKIGHIGPIGPIVFVL